LGKGHVEKYVANAGPKQYAFEQIFKSCVNEEQLRDAKHAGSWGEILHMLCCDVHYTSVHSAITLKRVKGENGTTSIRNRTNEC